MGTAVDSGRDTVCECGHERVNDHLNGERPCLVPPCDCLLYEPRGSDDPIPPEGEIPVGLLIDREDND